MDLSWRILVLSWLYLETLGDFDGRWPRQILSTTGLCHFGSRVDCCWGWVRHAWGHCQPFYILRQRIARIRCQPKAVCQPGCKHGECVGPNKCKCHPGYTGKICNQDLNECGLKPRPCKHRCMNTYGSYKCYCLNGYMLMPDGSCSNALTCSMANCQYGCDVVKGEIHCRCPSPGLQLAPDGRTCMDVDECITGSVTCPRFRKCVNTFGSYICKCHKGFDLMYIGGRYQCHDIDECSLGQYQCGRYSQCYNTLGSYKCKCKEEYRGDGLNCIRIPKVMIDPSNPYSVFKSNSTFLKGSSGMTNRIPDETTPQPEITVDNRIPFEPQKPRGDVFIPRQPGVSNNLLETFEIEQGISANEDEANDDPGVLIHSCNFDGGLCGWIKERKDDLHWEPVKDSSGGQYLSISQPKGKAGRFARLVLPLGHLARSEDLCLSFRHKVSGLHSGLLQVFLRKTGIHGPAIWGRNRGHGWSQTHITLKGPGIKSVIFKGEKGKGRTGEIGLDDISLRKGRCSRVH
ncbi:nephronectin [Crotalus adamanteus]|uniref:Nephronectin n=1 Tax=Crotalus adamanteus TaxID=8729 RepID=A0AAW1BAJ6_CROAD